MFVFISHEATAELVQMAAFRPVSCVALKGVDHFHTAVLYAIHGVHQAVDRGH